MHTSGAIFVIGETKAYITHPAFDMVEAPAVTTGGLKPEAGLSAPQAAVLRTPHIPAVVSQVSPVSQLYIIMLSAYFFAVSYSIKK